MKNIMLTTFKDAKKVLMDPKTTGLQIKTLPNYYKLADNMSIDTVSSIKGNVETIEITVTDTVTGESFMRTVSIIRQPIKELFKAIVSALSVVATVYFVWVTVINYAFSRTNKDYI